MTSRVDAAAEHARVEQVLRLLAPGGASRTATARGARGGAETYLPFPAWRGVRALLPTGSSAAAAAALRLRVPGAAPPRRAAYAAAAAGLRLGLGRLHPQRASTWSEAADSGPTLAQRIGGRLGTDVQLAVNVGRADPHRTVAVHVLAEDGHLLAFAKVTASTLAARQLATEAAALRRLAAAPAHGLVAPRLLAHETWEDLHVLLVSPLHLPGSRRPSAQDPPGAAVVRQVAATGDDVGLRVLATSGYWRRVHERLERLTSVAPVRTAPAAAAAELVARAHEVIGGAEVEMGAWHGDWVPWNLARAGGRLLVWDWEYYAPSVPLGFDVLHYGCGTAFFRDGLGARDALGRGWELGAPGLASLGLAPAAAARVQALYALEFLLRRLEIATHGGGQDDGRVFPQAFEAAHEALGRADRRPAL